VTRHNFQAVKRFATKEGFCPVCNKRSRKTRTFENTVNPFNRNEIGAPKSYQEVEADVTSLAVNWVPDFTHAKCAA
jgi:hypothetical protein